jgi:tetratricopeptide (TPR) repeat protein
MTFAQAVGLALQCQQAGRLSEAKTLYRAILEYAPQGAIAADLHQHLAFALEDEGDTRSAVEEYAIAQRLNPLDPLIHSNLAVALIRLGRIEEAEAICRRGIEEHPQWPDCYQSLGCALTEQGRAAEALPHLRRVIELGAGTAQAHYNLAAALMDLRRFEEAVAMLRQAIALDPNLAEAHAKLGIALLTLGQYQRGWSEYEWRLHWTRPASAGPMWDGSDLRGQPIVLEAEQGAGDAIMTVRYAPMLAQRGAGKVLVAAPKSLHRLLARARGVNEIVNPDRIPPDIARIPVMSLARMFNTDSTSIPTDVPYIDPDPALVRSWRERLPSDDGLRIGIVWAGNASQRDDRWRSCHLSGLAPLAGVAKGKLYSLQVGEAAAQIASAPFPITDLSPDLHDFADTAAAMMNLDLIITVDTAACHLAGALGRPVWTLLFATSDWRWLVDREDNPLYPTMRVFRQAVRGQWDDVVRRAAAELSRWSTCR